MAAKKRKKRKAVRRKRSPAAKRTTKRKRKRVVKRKRRKKPVARATPKPVKRRKKRKLSKAHLAKMRAGREAARRKHGPVLRAKVGESARGPNYIPPPRVVRHPIRNNPAKQWYKFCVHSGADYSEQVGYGTRAEAEAKAKTLLRGARKVELLGPYFTKAMAAKAA